MVKVALITALLMLILAASYSASYVLGYQDGRNGSDAERVRERVEETDPNWDCQTMGNGQCGPERTMPYINGQAERLDA